METSFNNKNGINIVSEKLGVSRYTVYNYIREVKAGFGELDIWRTRFGEKDREKLYTYAHRKLGIQ